MDHTRDRLIRVAMELFGQQGYHSTSVADIEGAAGLSPGSGSLYRHFRSKEELLAAGVLDQIARGEPLLAALESPEPFPELSLRDTLRTVVGYGLDRIEQDGDLNRLLLRDLPAFPELMEAARTQELARVHTAVAHLLRGLGDQAPRDWDALACVVVGAVSHYWLLRDIFDDHPSHVDRSRFTESVVDLVAIWIEHQSG